MLSHLASRRHTGWRRHIGWSSLGLNWLVVVTLADCRHIGWSSSHWLAVATDWLVITLADRRHVGCKSSSHWRGPVTIFLVQGGSCDGRCSTSPSSHPETTPSPFEWRRHGGGVTLGYVLSDLGFFFSRYSYPSKFLHILFFKCTHCS